MNMVQMFIINARDDQSEQTNREEYRLNFTLARTGKVR